MIGAGAVFALVALPLAAAGVLALCPLPARAGRRLAGVVVAAQLLLAVAIYLALHGQEAPPRLACSGPWLPGLGGRFDLTVDGINLYAILALAVVAAVALAADGPLDGDPGSRARLALGLAAVAGMTLYLLSRDLLLAAAGHGLAGLSLAGLLGLGTARGAGDAGRRFGTWAVIGTLLLAAAAAAAGIAGDSTVLDDIVGAAGTVAPVTAVLLGAALALQIPLVPFHTWLAPACAHGSGAGRVLVLGGWCVAGLFGVVRFALAVVPLDLSAAAPWPMAWAAATAVYGVVLALAPSPSQLGHRVAWICLALGGVAVTGVVSLDAGAVVGATTCAAAQAPLRAVVALLAAWSLRGGGGPRLAAAWVAVCLALVAVPGGGVFPGWLALMGGVGRVASGLTALLLVASAVGAVALLLPAVDLARAVGPRLPRGPMRALVAVLLLSAASGVHTAPFMEWARPQVERLLARMPADDAASPALDDAAADDDGGDVIDGGEEAP